MKQASEKRDAVIDGLWLLLLFAITSVWCLSSARHTSATYDEPTYLYDGMIHWRTGSYKELMRLGTMPLPVDVQTLPLYVWERVHGRQIDVVTGMGWILPWARAASLVFWALLLVYVFRIARAIGGPWAGRIASALVAVEPGLLAHASLATTDIAVTALLMAFAHEFAVAREKGPWRRWVLPAVLYGLAILAKASALVFAPVCMIVIEFWRLWKSDDFAKAGAGLKARAQFFIAGLWAFRGEFFKIVGIGLAVVFIYIRSDWTTEPTFITWAQGLKPGPLHDTMLWISQHLRIFTNAGEGLAQQIKHNMRADPTFIFGVVHKRAVWYYFPVALAIKCSIPFLLMPLVIAVFRRRALLNWPCLAALVLLAYSLTCRVQIGIRFMFPVLALASAGYGIAIARAMREMEPRWKRTALAAFTACALCYTAVVSAKAWPDAICYTNEMWGGTPDGYRLLSDSNYDWGQGLPDLIRWRDAHGVDVLDVWYFGLDPRKDARPLRWDPLSEDSFAGGKPWDELLRGKVLAVSTTNLYGTYRNATADSAAAWLAQFKPVDRTTTYFIYDFRSLPPQSP
ncbi:MAG TPA: glycosyltransferase family 39 protein [Chthoniobacteraceae bacterium]|nr:glycosyltransferase family 39 protein [Chthoniobacteraceae bacterium]